MSAVNAQVVIVDYGVGNLFSIENACRAVGLAPVISADRKTILNAPGLILPGVGAFGDAVEKLKNLDLFPVLKDFAQSNRPLMGVCLGMQLLMTESHEFGSHRGLALIEGYAEKFKPDLKLGFKVPQVQWNRIHLLPSSKANTPAFFTGIADGAFMYFVHSYFVMTENAEDTATQSTYAHQTFSSSVQRGNIFGVQFHPERSGIEGIQIYKNFKSCLMG